LQSTFWNLLELVLQDERGRVFISNKIRSHELPVIRYTERQHTRKRNTRGFCRNGEIIA
jgi:hypothetical protein